MIKTVRLMSEREYRAALEVVACREWRDREQERECSREELAVLEWAEAMEGTSHDDSL